MHFRGAYHNPAMFAPVTIPPVGGVLLLNTAFGESRRDRWLTRIWMRLTVGLGFVGSAFHVWGVHRNMGGWGNWRQNLLNGPPIPAPLQDHTKAQMSGGRNRPREDLCWGRRGGRSPRCGSPDSDSPCRSPVYTAPYGS